MSEIEKNEKAEVDQIDAEELDTVAGGVLGLQELEGGGGQADAISSIYSIGCTCSEQ